jgi:anti-sigma factor RsiW
MAGSDIADADLQAFVDGELDAVRRMAVEDHLSRDPVAAARVMADLKTRDGLRLAFAGKTIVPREETIRQAERLGKSLGDSRRRLAVARVAGIAALFAAGWAGNLIFTGVPESEASIPAVVSAASDAQRATLVRASLVSQPANALYDPAELEAGTGIQMPLLPPGWTVRDVQVFPVHDGYSIELTAEAAAGTVFLFAAPAEAAEVSAPVLVDTDDGPVAVWQQDGGAYALSGEVPPQTLIPAATALAASHP